MHIWNISLIAMLVLCLVFEIRDTYFPKRAIFDNALTSLARLHCHVLLLKEARAPKHDVIIFNRFCHGIAQNFLPCFGNICHASMATTHAI